MSEVTLHGQPVKVGDSVWSFNFGEIVVTEINSGAIYPIITNHGSYTIGGSLYYDEPARIFWQPIDQSAIEAAKVKPKPVYSYRWYNKFNDFVTERLTEERLGEIYPISASQFVPLPESKCEVKP